MRTCTVMLIGGSSGIGKTSLSKQLAEKYKVKLIGADQICLSVYKETRAEDYPAIHYWYGEEDWKQLSVEDNVDQLINVCKEISPFIKTIINMHLANGCPLILEGDFIRPELILDYLDQAVQGVFIYENDKKQIIQNYLNREGGRAQTFRADISYLFSQKIKITCEEKHLRLLDARPWTTLLKRLEASL